MSTGKNVPHDVYNEAKRLFVEQAKSCEDICVLIGGAIAVSTLYKYAKTPDDDGRTWYDLRIEYRDQLYQEASPQHVAQKLIEKINELLNADDFDTKSADAIAKLQRSLDRILDSSYQIPVMYGMLSDFVVFAKDHYPDLLAHDGGAFVACIRDFKNTLRERLRA